MSPDLLILICIVQFLLVSLADFKPLMILSFVLILDLLFVFLPCCICVCWSVSAKRGFSKTLCLQLLENQKSIILYPLWSFVTVLFSVLNTITILFALIIVILLSSGLRSHQIKMRKVEQIASYCFTNGSWECCIKGVSFSVEAKQSFIALFFFSFFPLFFFCVAHFLSSRAVITALFCCMVTMCLYVEISQFLAAVALEVFKLLLLLLLKIVMMEFRTM